MGNGDTSISFRSKEALAHLVGGSLAAEECGKQGKREKGGQFLSESRIPSSMLEAWNVQELHINY